MKVAEHKTSNCKSLINRDAHTHTHTLSSTQSQTNFHLFCIFYFSSGSHVQSPTRLITQSTKMSNVRIQLLFDSYNNVPVSLNVSGTLEKHQYWWSVCWPQLTECHSWLQHLSAAEMISVSPNLERGYVHFCSSSSNFINNGSVIIWK